MLSAGDFQFSVASDDNSEFWLSSDESPSNSRLTAFVGKVCAVVLDPLPFPAPGMLELPPRASPLWGCLAPRSQHGDNHPERLLGIPSTRLTTFQTRGRSSAAACSPSAAAALEGRARGPCVTLPEAALLLLHPPGSCRAISAWSHLCPGQAWFGFSRTICPLALS